MILSSRGRMGPAHGGAQVKEIPCSLPAGLCGLTTHVQEVVEILDRLVNTRDGHSELLAAKLKQLQIDGALRAYRVAEEFSADAVTASEAAYVEDLCRHLVDVLDIAANTSLEIADRHEAVTVRLAGEICKVLLRQVREIAFALVDFQDNAQVIERCTEVYRLQTIADRLLQSETAGGWEGRKSFVDIVAYRNLLDQLERATGKAEHVAELVHSITLQSA